MIKRYYPLLVLLYILFVGKLANSSRFDDILWIQISYLLSLIVLFLIAVIRYKILADYSFKPYGFLFLIVLILSSMVVWYYAP
mgnify:CR=1 FL=1